LPPKFVDVGAGVRPCRQSPAAATSARVGASRSRSERSAVPSEVGHAMSRTGFERVDGAFAFRAVGAAPARGGRVASRASGCRRNSPVPQSNPYPASPIHRRRTTVRKACARRYDRPTRPVSSR
jgi:hypothetical protein